VIVAFLTLISACPALVAANVTSVENPRMMELRMLGPPDLALWDLQFEGVRL
jgi:hypothetical protein